MDGRTDRRKRKIEGHTKFQADRRQMDRQMKFQTDERQTDRKGREMGDMMMTDRGRKKDTGTDRQNFQGDGKITRVTEKNEGNRPKHQINARQTEGR